MDPQPSTPTTIGRFRIDSVLGRGGMGEVYKAFDPTLQRTVALKTVRPGIESREYLDRLYREAQACARLAHPNIVTVFEAGEIGNAVYIAMEYVVGENLASVLQKGGLTLEERLRIVLQILSALQHAHEGGVIHRDIKPANVIRQPAGTIKLVDFGLARTAEAEPLTVTGMVMGTIDYASPEQLRGEHVDHRSDIYSTGVLAYEMVAGRRPFPRNSDLPALIYKIVHEPPPPLNEYMRTTFPALAEIISRSIAKSPDDRYLSAAAMHADVERFMRDSRDLIAAVELARAQADDPDARTGEQFRSRPPTPPKVLSEVEGPTFVAKGTSTTSRTTVPVVEAAATPPPATAKPDPKTWGLAALAVAALIVAAFVLFRPSPATDETGGAPSRPASGSPSGSTTELVASASPGPNAAARPGDAMVPNAPPATPVAAPAASAASPAAAPPDSTLTASSPAAVPVMPAPGASAPVPGAKELFETSAAGTVRTGLRFRLIRRLADDTEADVDPETVFHTGEKVRFAFDSNVDGFLYVVAQGSSGQWAVLFPDPEINRGRNAIRRGEEYEVPREDIGGFEFKGEPGAERVFVFLSRKPLKELPGFDRPVTRPETLMASVVDNLRLQVQSRDLVFAKTTAPGSPGKKMSLSNYVVNPAALGDAVAVSITLQHAR